MRHRQSRGRRQPLLHLALDECFDFGIQERKQPLRERPGAARARLTEAKAAAFVRRITSCRRGVHVARRGESLLHLHVHPCQRRRALHNLHLRGARFKPLLSRLLICQPLLRVNFHLRGALHNLHLHVHIITISRHGCMAFFALTVVRRRASPQTQSRRQPSPPPL